MANFQIPSDTLLYALMQGTFIACIVLPLIFKNVLDLTPGKAPFGAQL
jgi:hypothetical protein